MLHYYEINADDDILCIYMCICVNTKNEMLIAMLINIDKKNYSLFSDLSQMH